MFCNDFFSIGVFMAYMVYINDYLYYIEMTPFSIEYLWYLSSPFACELTFTTVILPKQNKRFLETKSVLSDCDRVPFTLFVNRFFL